MRFFYHARMLLALSAILAAGSLLACTSNLTGNPKVEQYSNDPQAYKISVKLLQLEQRMRREQLSLTEAAVGTAIVATPRGVMLNIVTTRLDADIQKKFAIPGVIVLNFSPRYHRVALSIDDIALLHRLADIPEVTMISPEYGARTHGAR